MAEGTGRKWLAVRLYRDEGLSLRAAAAKAGTSYSAVQRALEEAGVPRRPAGGRRAADWAAVAAAVDTGLTMREAAGKFGIGCATVSRIMADRNPVEEGMVNADEAAVITGLPGGVLADAADRGLIRSKRPGRCHRRYYLDEIRALAERRQP